MTHTDYNAGNFQEYTYECEWIECTWKNIYTMTHLVSAFWYPWIYNDKNNRQFYRN